MQKSRLAKDAMLAEFTADQSIVLDLDAQRYHTVNTTAAFIWRGLENDLSDDEIIDGLEREFDVTRERATAALGAFLDDLASRGFLNTADRETVA